MKSLLWTVIAAVFLSWTASAQQDATAAKTAAKTRNVGVEEFDRLRSGKDVVVLDVRTPAEFADGMIQGSVLLDYRAADFAENVELLAVDLRDLNVHFRLDQKFLKTGSDHVAKQRHRHTVRFQFPDQRHRDHPARLSTE